MLTIVQDSLKYLYVNLFHPSQWLHERGIINRPILQIGKLRHWGVKQRA